MKKKLDIKKLVLLNLPYVFAFYFVDKLAAVFRLAPGTEFIDKLTGGFANFGAAFANPLPSFHPVDLLIGVAGGALLKLAVYIKGKNRKKFRQGEEYGSARWGRPEDIRPYIFQLTAGAGIGAVNVLDFLFKVFILQEVVFR